MVTYSIVILYKISNGTISRAQRYKIIYKIEAKALIIPIIVAILKGATVNEVIPSIAKSNNLKYNDATTIKVGSAGIFSFGSETLNDSLYLNEILCFYCGQ